MTQYATSSAHFTRRAWPTPRVLRGFTTIELMVVMAIMSVLMALAAPSFTPLIEGWRVRQAAEQLQSTLYYARSEAIKRGGQVIVQKLPDGTNGCATASVNTAWSCGWRVCHNKNKDDICDITTNSTTNEELQRYDAPSQIAVERTSGGTTIKLNRWGIVDGLPNFSIRVKPYGKPDANPSARLICVSSGGRIRITTAGKTSCDS